MQPSGLPIDDALPALQAALAKASSVVLQAPPGAGKSTVVPLALLGEPWAAGKKLLMLEPRRLAARAVAQRMAATLGEAVGATVGYRMRLDTRISRATRIEVITEGVLTRMLQSDPALEGVALVIFDEFHERSLHADLGLALAIDARANIAPHLKLLVMSATLDGEPVAQLLGGAPIVAAEGRTFSVETRYIGRGAPPLGNDAPRTARGPAASASMEAAAANAVRRALAEEEGDVLVFLPGGREIRRVQSMLQEQTGERSPAHGVRVLPLYGDLSREAQDEALARGGTARKVVLATNIAETSLTIEGVRIVIDSGLVRRSQFDPSTGLDRLETQRISRASADQRRGRAGRTAPGICFRLWSEEAHRSLAAFTPPEIQSADLTALALELAGWGIGEPAGLRWLDPPRPAAFGAARDLLSRLGALDPRGRVTSHGREMAALGVHPRLAHMLLRSRDLGASDLAADLAALLSERDLLRIGGDADIRSRLEGLRREPGSSRGEVDAGALQRVRRAAKDLVRQIGTDARVSRRDSTHRTATGAEPLSPGAVLSLAFPDRIGRSRGASGGCYTLTSGRGACFAGAQSLARRSFIVAVDLEDTDPDARIRLAAPLDRAELDALFADRLITLDVVEWSSREEAVVARRVTRLDGIVLDDKPLDPIPADAARVALLAGIRELGVAALPWTRDARDLQARIEFARRIDPDGSWPAVGDEALAASLETWLSPWLDGVSRRAHLARLPMIEALRSQLSWDRQRKLDELAPTHLDAPTGSRIRVDYGDEQAPSISVRLQEVFGLDATPRIGGGRVPVTFKLLSPAQRPLQITRDLASFWRGAYAEVRKDMRGRYPRHYWPENPLEAEPTRRAKPRHRE